MCSLKYMYVKKKKKKYFHLNVFCDHVEIIFKNVIKIQKISFIKKLKNIFLKLIWTWSQKQIRMEKFTILLVIWDIT